MNYWSRYTLKEKIYELGVLSAKRNRLMLDLVNNSDLDVDMMLKLMSGELTNVLEIDTLCDEILTEISQ